VKKITFKTQFIAGIVIVALGAALSSIFKQGIIANAAICIYGALFLINPVQPENSEKSDYGRAKVRLLGVLIIIFGTIIRFGT